MGSSQSSQSSSEPTRRLQFASSYEYEPPNSSVSPIAHYIFLVHGWLGNDLEMDYLSSAIRDITSSMMEHDDKNSTISSATPDDDDDNNKRIRKSNSYESRLLASQYNNISTASDAITDGDDNNDAVAVRDIVIHSVKCNVGRTHDGIRKGGTRLAHEIIEFISSDVEQKRSQRDGNENNSNAEEDSTHVTYSIVGNSLGGLYARYALSLISYQIPLRPLRQHTDDTIVPIVHLHPNVFCTTATPHLGVSRHTYLPIPRIAEKLIGTGMGTTGRDLFRLNSEKDPPTGSGSGNGASSLRGETTFLPSEVDAELNDSGDDAVVSEQLTTYGDDDEEMECIIRNMCLQEKYLSPLRNFRRRIAYANVYGTDFQVPTVTAAFLNERSGVGHFVVASREVSSTGHGRGGVKQGANSSNESGQEQESLPSFIVAVVRTEEQAQRQSPSNSGCCDATAKPSDELLQMSQSMDALGWTKVFIDVRDRIPFPGVARPAWLRPRHDSLDDLIRKRIRLQLPSTNNDVKLSASSKRKASDDTASSKSLPTTVDTCNDCILTSQDLAQSTQVGDSIHFPMGHTVMIANAKNEKYSEWNRLGRPVMDRLAQDLVKNILEFE
jgi:hypothetical protein